MKRKIVVFLLLNGFVFNCMAGVDDVLIQVDDLVITEKMLADDIKKVTLASLNPSKHWRKNYMNEEIKKTQTEKADPYPNSNKMMAKILLVLGSAQIVLGISNILFFTPDLATYISIASGCMLVGYFWFFYKKDRT